MNKAVILTWDRFQDHEVIYPYYSLQEHEFDVKVAASEHGRRIHGDLGGHIVSDVHVNALSINDYTDRDILVIPGGVKALEKLRLQTRAVDFVKQWFKLNRMVFCICNGAQLLITADVLKGRKCSGYYSIEPDIKNAGAEYITGVCVDGNLVSCDHYNLMGKWMREGYKAYASKVKALG